MEERECIIALNTVGTVGGLRFAGLMQRFGSAQAILCAQEWELRQVKGIGKKTARRIMSLRDGETFRQEMRKAKELGVNIVTVNDSSYPTALRNTSCPPPVLYILGEVLPSHAFAIAIVGSRTPSYYGSRVARLLSKNAAEVGFTVVSGMARVLTLLHIKGLLKEEDILLRF